MPGEALSWFKENHARMSQVRGNVSQVRGKRVTGTSKRVTGTRKTCHRYDPSAGNVGDRKGWGGSAAWSTDGMCYRHLKMTEWSMRIHRTDEGGNVMTVRQWDPSENLDTSERIEAWLETAVSDDDRCR
ncbi:MAG: hypothetical protein IIT33_01645 [Prevotella sp.]|nr:hypothetical protein [Prevotella sp.]